MSSSRRQLLQTLGIAGLGLAWRPAAWAGSTDEALLERLDACSPHDDPLQALQDGNARFAAAWSRAAQEDDPQLRMTLLQALLGEHCQVDPKALAKGQHPWAAVLTCADSRIPVEWIFALVPASCLVCAVLAIPPSTKGWPRWNMPLSCSRCR